MAVDSPRSPLLGNRSPRHQPNRLRVVQSSAIAVAVVLLLYQLYHFSAWNWQHPMQRPSLALAWRSGESQLHSVASKDMRQQLVFHYTMYSGMQADCAHGTILSMSQSRLTVDDVLELCLHNPNCTYFTYRQQQHAFKLCSGRINKLQTASLTPAIGTGWVSGDKIGCEHFDIGLSVAHHRSATLPQCSVPPAGCSFSIGPFRRCLRNLLDVRADGSIRAGGRFFCQNELFGLELRSKKDTRSCNWTTLISTADDGEYHGLLHSTANVGYSHKKLFPDLLTEQHGKLVTPALCLCHNKVSGLAIGPYCGNSDCLWDVAQPGCYFRNRDSSTCLAALISGLSDAYETAEHLQPLCYDPLFNSVYIAHQLNTDPSSDRCLWTRHHGSLINSEAFVNLLDVIYLDHQGSLLAGPTKCLCFDEDQGLHLTTMCRAQSCTWTTRASTLPLQQLSRSYTVYQHASLHSCVLQLEPQQYTSSALEALDLCSSRPLCTYVAYNQQTGAALLCQGHYAQVDTDHHDGWLMAFKKGCEDYAEEKVFNDLLLGKPPACFQETCWPCIQPAKVVLPCTPNTQATCDVCDKGYCPYVKALQGKPLHRQQDEDTSMVAACSTTIQQHDAAHIVIGKAHVHTCSKDSMYDNAALQQLDICKYDQAKLAVGLCHQVALTSLQYTSHGRKQEIMLFGPLQGFTFKGHPYIIATMASKLDTNHKESAGRQRILLQLSTGMNRIEAISPVQCSLSIFSSSWMVLPTEDTLFIVTSLVPLVVMMLDTTTGHCKEVQRSYQVNDVFYNVTAGHTLRGEVALLPSGSNYVGMAYRKISYPYGDVYSQHIVVLTAAGNMFRIKHLSKPFRLSAHQGNDTALVTVDDIQHVTGLLLFMRDHKTVPHLAAFYTHGTCKVRFSAVPFDMQLDDFPIPSTALIPKWKTSQTTVRWEIDSLSPGLLGISQQLFTSAHNDEPSILMDIVDASWHVHKHVATISQEMTGYADSAFKSAIIASNAKYNFPAHITVRVLWPPNLFPSNSNKLVVYLHWAFASFPEDWAQQINIHASQVWVPSTFAKNVLLQGGVKPDVHVLSNPFAVEACTLPRHDEYADHPQPSKQKPFRYLFSACASWAHGVDLVLKAFMSIYTHADNVALVIHSTCQNGDAVQYVLDVMTQAALDPATPQVEVLEKPLSSEALQSLIRTVDVVVLPLRADAGGQVVGTVLSYGLPVIVPDKGSHVEHDMFFSIKVKSMLTVCARGPCLLKDGSWSIDGAMTSSQVRWIETDTRDLAMAMKRAMRSYSSLLPLASASSQQLCKKYGNAQRYANTAKLLIGLLSSTGW